MKRNIKFIGAVMGVVLAAAALTGCVRFEEDDLFGESAAQRAETLSDEVQNLLVSAPQGWVMQYHTGTGVAVYEGFNLFAKFEKSGKVTLAGDHRYLRGGKAGTYTEAVSLYEIIREESIVLAFNTWNDVLTPFVDPVDPEAAPAQIVKDGAGMQGDQNLVVVSYNDNEVVLRGERYGAEVRLVKADRPWKTYITDTDSMKSVITNSTLTSYYLTDGTDTLYYVDLKNGTYTQNDRIEDPLNISELSCCFTPNGFRNEHKGTMGGHSYQEFTLTSDKSGLVNEDGTVKVIPTWDLYILNCPSFWRITPESFTAEQTTLYQQMEAEIQKVNSNYVLDSIAIGRMSETQGTQRVRIPALVLCVHGPTKMGRTPQYNPYLNMNILKPEFGTIKFEQSPAIDASNAYMDMFAATTLKTLLQQFAASLYGTYTMQPDDCFRPTWATLTPVVGGSPLKLNLKKIKD